MASQSPATGLLRSSAVSHRTLMVWRLLSAIVLLAMGGIHLYLVFYGVGGLLGTLFVLNAVGALVLAIGVLVLHGRLLLLATVLSFLFLVGTLVSLVLALTVGLFGIHEQMSFTLVPTTLVVESIGAIILAVTGCWCCDRNEQRPDGTPAGSFRIRQVGGGRRCHLVSASAYTAHCRRLQFRCRTGLGFFVGYSHLWVQQRVSPDSS